MKKGFKLGIMLVFLLIIACLMPNLVYAGDISNDGVLATEEDSVYPKTDSATTLGKTGNEWEDVYSDSYTLGGVAITSWGEVVSPWSDNGTYISPTGAPAAIKAYLNGNMIIIGDMDADSYIMENDAQLDNASNNTVTLTENTDIFSVVFDGDDITLSASDGSIELYPQADATEGTVDLLTGGDTDDYIQISTTTNQPLINFVGCDGSITAASGSISFGDENLSTTGTLSSGATTVTSVIIGDDTYDVVVDDEHRFTSNDSDVVVDVFATTDKDAILQLTADLSADSGDEWQLKNDDADSNALLFINDTGGSLATIMDLSVGGVLTMTSNIVMESADTIDNATDDTFQFSSNDLDTTIRAYGYEGKDAILRLTADQSDDNGDEWVIKHEADDNSLSFMNDSSGSSVAKFSIGSLGVCIVGNISNTGDLYIGGAVTAAGMKSGTDQSAAGASADELYIDTDTNAVMIGT